MKILFYPKPLTRGHKIYFILDYLGVEFTDDINDDIDIVFHWDYSNRNTVSEEVLLLGKPIINSKCNNVKKDFLEEKFVEVFGYTSFVDPEKHYGYCVQKSTQQAIHNGKIIKCPTKRDYNKTFSKTGESHNRIYQKLIDTRISKNVIHDIRVPIVGNKIPIVFIKELGVNSTFHPYDDEYYNVYTDDIKNVFYGEEIEKIMLLAKKVGMEFGEFDVLRNNSDGLIYVVDMNNISMGSLFKYIDNKEEAIMIMGEAFKNEFL